MKKELSQLSKEEFKLLKSMGVLYDVYPEADTSWSETQKYSKVVYIFKKVLACADEYDIIKLKSHAREWLNRYGKN